MPHISKRLLEKNKFLDIHKQLYKILSTLSRSGKANVIFDELMTKTEKIMFAKRLAIILMLDQNESIYAIEQVLKVSPSTVARMSVLYDNGAYSKLLKEFRSQNSLWTQIQKIIPPRVGRDRFKNFLQF